MPPPPPPPPPAPPPVAPDPPPVALPPPAALPPPFAAPPPVPPVGAAPQARHTAASTLVIRVMAPRMPAARARDKPGTSCACSCALGQRPTLSARSPPADGPRPHLEGDCHRRTTRPTRAR